MTTQCGYTGPKVKLGFHHETGLTNDRRNQGLKFGFLKGKSCAYILFVPKKYSTG